MPSMGVREPQHQPEIRALVEGARPAPLAGLDSPPFSDEGGLRAQRPIYEMQARDGYATGAFASVAELIWG